jgi:hypothetical protein
MKSSARNLLLVPQTGRVNKKRRYFNLRNAVKQAMLDAVAEGKVLTIYDTDRGMDVATVGCHPSGINVIVLSSNRTFKILWNR